MMKGKYCIYLFIGLFFLGEISAQDQAKRFYLGGKLGFNYATDIDPAPVSFKFRSTSGFISPEFGYFMNDHLCLGAGISFSFYNRKIIVEDESTADLSSQAVTVLGRWQSPEDSATLENYSSFLYLPPYEKSHNHTFGLLFFGKYHWSIGPNLDLALCLSISPGIVRYSTYDFDNNVSHLNMFDLSAALRPEVHYSFTENIGMMLILPGLGAYYEKEEQSENNSFKYVGFNPELSDLNLGIFYRF